MRLKLLRIVNGINKDKLTTFLYNKCLDNTINYSTHKEVYNLIKVKLGYPLPN